MSNVSLIDGHDDENTPLLRAKVAMEQLNSVNSILEVLNWCKKLGVCMRLEFEEGTNKYSIGLYKDGMYTTVYFNSDTVYYERNYPFGIYDSIIKAVQALNTAIENKEETNDQT